MAGSVNRVILIGNLGKDPEVRTLENGAKLAKFPIATSESYKDKDGNKQTQTEWHNIIVWRGLADIAERYLKKGNAVFIEGKIKSRSWQDEQGNSRYAVEIVADNMTLLGGNPNSGSQSGYQQADSPSAPSVNESNMLSGSADMTDDLPF